MYRKLLILSVSLSLVGCAVGTPSPQDKKPLSQRPDIRHFTLDNGLDVYLLHRPQTGVEMRLLVKSGSVQEDEKQLGLAHFTEHMAFKGTTNFPGTTGFKKLESLGMKLGSHVNAATSLNSTTYKLSLPNANPVQIKTGLTILSDWAFHMTYDPVEFDKERPVIVEEWRLRQGIGFRINHQLEELRYYGSRYLARDPIGDLNIVKHGDVKEAKRYYDTWYQPERMALILVGNFNQGDAVADIKTLFNTPNSANKGIDDPSWHQFANHKDLLIKTIFDKEQGSRILQFTLQRTLPAPLNSHQGQYEDLMDSLWLSILNQRFSTIVDNGLVPSISANTQGALLDARRSQQLMIAHPKGNDYQGTLDILFTEVQRLATQQVTQEELDNARNALLKRLSQQAAGEDRYEHDYLANQITTAIELNMPIQTKKQALNLSYQLINKVTPETLTHYFSNYLKDASPRVAIIGPDSDASVFDSAKATQRWLDIRQSNPGAFALKTQAVTLDIQPEKTGSIVSTQSLPIEKTQEWTLSNNINVIIKNDNNLKDNIQVSLRIPGGSSLETNENLGMVQWALNLPEISGYGHYNARELALFTKQHQISLRPYSELLFHGFRGEAPIEELDTLLTLMHLKITSPQFNGEKLEQQKQSMALGIAKTPVERIFLDNINKESYQNGERLVIDPQGAWRQFSAQQLQQTNQLILGQPADMTLVISGPITLNQVKPMVERWIASIPERSTQRLYWADPAINPKLSSFSKTYPIASSDKSMVSIQYAAPAQWSQQNVLALNILDTIVSQRLRLNLRERAGGIYSLGFSEMLTKVPTSFYTARLNFTASPQRADELITLARNVITEIKQSGITEKELKEAKNIWFTENGQVRDSASYWTDALAQVATDDKQYQRLLNEPTIINALSVNDINQVAHQWLGNNEKVFKLTPPTQK
ncbi:M16 family metallopeptidase [Proteus myxofaciens]|uniref:Putative zinc protease n=1 Tax=Proteus myxofaciens ATCC 19692 TaxID=1354337 RepID=A0A198FN11_9GAMM|nr:insulinase family protein [Proteus myxofaciens]OAT26165.1 putative zinc protease [Proteus myxofaciens ATCC 19692]